MSKPSNETWAELGRSLSRAFSDAARAFSEFFEIISQKSKSEESK